MSVQQQQKTSKEFIAAAERELVFKMKRIAASANGTGWQSNWALYKQCTLRYIMIVFLSIIISTYVIRL